MVSLKNPLINFGDKMIDGDGMEKWEREHRREMEDFLDWFNRLNEIAFKGKKQSCSCCGECKK